MEHWDQEVMLRESRTATGSILRESDIDKRRQTRQAAGEQRKGSLTSRANCGERDLTSFVGKAPEPCGKLDRHFGCCHRCTTLNCDANKEHDYRYRPKTQAVVLSPNRFRHCVCLEPGCSPQQPEQTPRSLDMLDREPLAESLMRPISGSIDQSLLRSRNVLQRYIRVSSFTIRTIRPEVRCCFFYTISIPSV